MSKKAKAYLYDEHDGNSRDRMTSREKSMAKSQNTTDYKTGKLRKSSRKNQMED